MFSKVILFATIAYVSAQHAAKYPAGVDPAKCPGFPICDNAALHNPHAHNHWNQPAWNAAPQWNAGHDNGQWNAGHDNGQWNPAHDDGQWNGDEGQWNNQWNDDGQWKNDGQWNQGHNQWNGAHNQWNAAPAAHSGGDKYPAGVNPHSCPNYPYCDTNAGHAGGHHAAPLPGYTERLYPAGVSPHSCPNYPNC